MRRKLILLLVLPAVGVRALATPDPRIVEVPFHPARVVTVAARAGVTTLVRFADNEHVKSIGAGQGADCAQANDAWCVSWPANSGFLYVRPKPRAAVPLTLAVVTDQRLYSLQFEPVVEGSSRVAVHRLVFTYPQVTQVADAQGSPDGERPFAMALPAVSEAQVIADRLNAAPLPVNANYSIAYGPASGDLRPALTFDDGRFTYLKWSGNREVPAIFEIRADGSEMVANTRMQGDLIVVDRIARGLMLRSGSAVASVRNESFDPDGRVPVDGTTADGVARMLKEPVHE